VSDERTVKLLLATMTGSVAAYQHRGPLAVRADGQVSATPDAPGAEESKYTSMGWLINKSEVQGAPPARLKGAKRIAIKDTVCLRRRADDERGAASWRATCPDVDATTI